MVALPFSSKKLTQIYYQFITNIFLAALLSIHHKFTLFTNCKDLFTKHEKLLTLVMPTVCRRPAVLPPAALAALGTRLCAVCGPSTWAWCLHAVAEHPTGKVVLVAWC